MHASRIARILGASKLMFVPVDAAARREHSVARHEHLPAEAAAEAVRGVGTALRSMRIPGLRVGEELTAKARVGHILDAASFVGVAQPPSIRNDHPHEAVLGDEDPVAVGTLEPVGWVLLAGRRVAVPCGRVGEELAAEAAVLRIPLARHLVQVTASQAIAVHETENVESGDVGSRAEPTFETIRRIHLALDGMSIPCIWVRKHLATVAHVGWICLATKRMSITKLTSILCEDAEGRPKLLWAEHALEVVCRVHLAPCGVIIPCN